MALAALVAGASLPARSADAGSLNVSAVVLSKSNCKFDAGAMTLNFGTIDPSASSPAAASTTKGFSCAGSATNATFAISAADGLHSTGPGMRRLKHAAAAEYMAYSLTLSPTSATVPKNSAQTLTVTGSIDPTEFQDRSAGVYSDTVTITLTP